MQSKNTQRTAMKVLTVKEAAEYLKLNEFTIYRLAKAGEIPSFKVGRSLRFRSDILDRWMERKVAQGERLAVLVVDDDDAVRAALKEVASRAGCSVAEAATGQDAIDFVVRERFDIVFLDIMLPDISGTEAFKRIKVAAPATPVAIITGYADSQQTIEALAMGPMLLLRKPLQVADIRQVLAMFTRTGSNLRPGVQP